MHDNNFAAALEDMILISVSLIGMIRKPTTEPIVQTMMDNPAKAQSTIQVTTDKGIQTMLCPLLSR